MKEAKIRFTHDTSEWWNYEVTDKKTKEVIIKGRTKLGLLVNLPQRKRLTA